MMIDKCKARGINGRELEKHKQAAETSFEVSKESLKKDGGLLS
jgi:hypothetical protein